MASITRRTFAGGAAALASTGLLHRAAAQAAQAEATRTLPRTHAGRTLRITWGSTPSYDQLIAFCRQFTEASGIALEFSKLQQADRSRLTGERALALRAKQLAHGVALHPSIPPILAECAARTGLAPPNPLPLVARPPSHAPELSP